MIGTTLPLPLMLMVEKTLNQRLKQDNSSLQQLQKLNGLVFEIALRDPAMNFFLIPTPEGVCLLRHHEAIPDARIAASTLGLFRASRNEHKMDALFNGDLTIEGNQAAAESLLRILGGVDSDPFARLADIIGIAPAGLIERQVDQMRTQVGIWRRTRQLETVDFVLYERSLLAEPEQIQAHLDGIDAVRDRVDRLALRIDHLVERMKNEKDAL